MHQDAVLNRIRSALERLSLPTSTLTLEIPADARHGDYTSNIALTLAKTQRTAPLTLAQQIAQSMSPDEVIERVEAVAPGFVNVFLSPSSLLSGLQSDISHMTLTSALSGRSYTVEFTDPNPFKEFHIGHLYSNTVGESISRLLEAVGVKVRRVNYQGDVGIHVACSVWGMINKTRNSKFEILNTEGDTICDFTEMEKLPLSERVKWMGQCYALGATAYKEDESTKKDIQALNAQIFQAAQTMWKRERRDFTPHVDYARLITREIFPQDTVQEFYELGRTWTLEYFETIYARLGTQYANKGDYYYESAIGELGYDLVHQHLADGVFERSDGAIVFKGEQYGLHTRVFVNSLGLPTYEAKEMGLNPTKYHDQPFDVSLIVTADEIEEYFKVVLKAMSMVSPDVASRTRHIAHGVVRLPEGKMSSRTGQIIGAEELLEEVHTRLLAKVQESGRIQQGAIEQTVERLAIAAVKYSFLRPSLGKDVIFDFDESLSFEGDSGPYLLYTIVRCRSILDKAKFDGVSNNLALGTWNLALDLPLLRLLIHFPDVVVNAAEQYAPHMVCTYLHKLAQEFNAYYDKAPILKAEGDLRTLRLLIVQKVAETLSRGSHMLGFETVERM